MKKVKNLNGRRSEFRQLHLNLSYAIYLEGGGQYDEEQFKVILSLRISPFVVEVEDASLRLQRAFERETCVTQKPPN